MINDDPRDFENVQVFAGDNFRSAAAAKIDRLKIDVFSKLNIT